jgi:hypothetical protein
VELPDALVKLGADAHTPAAAATGNGAPEAPSEPSAPRSH